MSESPPPIVRKRWNEKEHFRIGVIDSAPPGERYNALGIRLERHFYLSRHYDGWLAAFIRNKRNVRDSKWITLSPDEYVSEIIAHHFRRVPFEHARTLFLAVYPHVQWVNLPLQPLKTLAARNPKRPDLLYNVANRRKFAGFFASSANLRSTIKIATQEYTQRHLTRLQEQLAPANLSPLQQLKQQWENNPLDDIMTTPADSGEQPLDESLGWSWTAETPTQEMSTETKLTMDWLQENQQVWLHDYEEHMRKFNLS